jgi:hypothetical protein
MRIVDCQVRLSDVERTELEDRRGYYIINIILQVPPSLLPNSTCSKTNGEGFMHGLMGIVKALIYLYIADIVVLLILVVV